MKTGSKIVHIIDRTVLWAVDYAKPALEREGYEVTIFTTYLMYEIPKESKPDVVIVSIGKLNEVESLITGLVSKNIPVVLIRGIWSDKEELAAFRLKIADCMARPYVKEDLLEFVKAINHVINIPT